MSGTIDPWQIDDNARCMMSCVSLGIKESRIMRRLIAAYDAYDPPPFNASLVGDNSFMLDGWTRAAQKWIDAGYPDRYPLGGDAR